LQDLQSKIDRIKAKQLAFRQLKVNNRLKEHPSELFSRYIDSLQKDEPCRYMTGITCIINLCSSSFSCRFKGEIYKSFTKDPKKECLREKMVRFERILEH